MYSFSVISVFDSAKMYLIINLQKKQFQSLQYADASILEELIPKVVELLKGSVGLGTRIACTHFVILLVVQMGQDLQPYTGTISFISSMIIHFYFYRKIIGSACKWFN